MSWLSHPILSIFIGFVSPILLVVIFIALRDWCLNPALFHRHLAYLDISYCTQDDIFVSNHSTANLMTVKASDSNRSAVPPVNKSTSKYIVTAKANATPQKVDTSNQSTAKQLMPVPTQTVAVHSTESREEGANLNVVNPYAVPRKFIVRNQSTANQSTLS